MANVPVDNKARLPGVGANATRSDLQGNQPIRVPAGMPYGRAKQIETAEQALRLPSTTGAPSGPSPAPGPPTHQLPAQSMAPNDLISTLGHQSNYPDQNLGSLPAPPALSLAMKVDALRYLSTLPYASPEIRMILRQAESELATSSENEQFPNV